MKIQANNFINRADSIGNRNTPKGNNSFVKALEEKGYSVSIGKLNNVKQIEKYVRGLAGTSNPFMNVKIAPNIAEQAANNPAVAEKYMMLVQRSEDNIRNFIQQNTWSAGSSSRSVEIWASAIIIDEDGNVSEWVDGVMTLTSGGAKKDDVNNREGSIKTVDCFNEYISFRQRLAEEYKQNLKIANGGDNQPSDNSVDIKV
jgi:hypothetical protein